MVGQCGGGGCSPPPGYATAVTALQRETDGDVMDSEAKEDRYSSHDLRVPCLIAPSTTLQQDLNQKFLAKLKY